MQKILSIKLAMLAILVLVAVFCPEVIQAASINLSPVSGSFLSGCKNEVDIYVDASGQSSNAADMVINYTPGLTIVDQDSTIPGIQIETATAYDSYIYNLVDTSNFRIRLAASSFSVPLTTNDKFATIQFTGGSGPVSFSINFSGSGSTGDSNVANTLTSNDLLTSVSNASFTINPGACADDQTPPSVSFTVPAAGSINVPANQVITFTAIDDLSGVDPDTLEVVLNGQLYAYGSPALAVNFVPGGISVIFDPNENLYTNQVNIIQVSVADTSGNTSYSQTTFNGAVSSGGGPTDPGEQPGDGEVPDGTEAPEVCSLPEVVQNAIVLSPSAGLKDTVFEGTVVEQAVEQIGITGTGAAISGFVVLLTVLPSLSLLTAPGLIATYLGFVLGRRQHRPWGVVSDFATGKPVAFATCRLYLAGTTAVVNQTIADLQGKYGFTIGTGNYRLEVSKDGYNTYRYDFQISKGEDSQVFDVSLIPVSLTGQVGSRWNILSKQSLMELGRRILTLISQLGFGLGLVLAILGAIYLPSTLNWIILGGYLLFVVAMLGRRIDFHSKNAAVQDSQNGLRIPFATVKFFKLETEELIDTQTTTQAGLFDFWGDAGEYGVYVSARGYSFPSQKADPEILVGMGRLKLEKHKLLSGNNRLTLLVDPLGNSATNDGNLATPFGN